MTIGKDDRARASRSLAESNFRYTGHAVRLHQLAKGLLPMNALDRFVQLLRKIGIEFTNLGCVSDEAFIRCPHVFGLHLDRLFQGFGAHELLCSRRVVLE